MAINTLSILDKETIFERKLKNYYIIKHHAKRG